jgi:acyl-CoA thioesterase-1
MTYSEIHVWGDSLARGIIYNEQKGRYAISRERCVTRLSEELSCKVTDHSVMGATVLDGLKHFDAAPPSPGALCVVEFGGNDCDLNWRYVSEHPDEAVTPRVPLGDFQLGLTRFVREIRAKGMTPLLITPLPLHAKRYFAWVTRDLNAAAVLSALGDVEHIYRWQERYANAVRTVARQTHCRLLDLRDVFLARTDYDHLMCIDGIHPNDAGHRLLAEEALKMIQEDAEQTCVPEETENAAVTAIPSAAGIA